MAENFQNTAGALFKGMEEFVTSKTVVGEAVYVGDTILLPLIEVSFGMAASAKTQDRGNAGGGGMGGKMTPTSVLVIRGGQVRVVNVRNADGLSRLIDMVPDLVSRFSPKDPMKDEKVRKAVDEAAQKEEEF